jgi:hypothetical protein
MVYPLFRRGIRKIYSSISVARSGYSRKHDDGSLPLESLSKTSRRGKLRSVNPLPTTFNDGDLEDGVDEWNSKDRIVTQEAEVGQEEQDLRADMHGGASGIMVTKETNIRRDDPSPEQLEGHTLGIGKTGVSESATGSFKYQEGNGLKYTVYAERG